MSAARRPWPSADADEVRVARYGLTPSPAPGWLEGADWPGLLEGCTHRGLLGLLADSVADGARVLTVDERDDLADRVSVALALSVQLEREMLEVAAILVDQAVDFRVLKGAANAHLDYPDPALRLFGDVDVVIPVDAFDVVRAAIEAAGFVVTWPIQRVPVEFRFEKGITTRSPRGFELDLHRVLISGPFGECWDPARLFDTVEWFEVGGQILPALGREERFIHACIAATISDPVPRIRPARDVAQLLFSPSLDHDRVLRLAHRWGLSVIVARAVLLSVGWLDLTTRGPLTVWAAAYRRTTRDQVRLALFSRRRLVGSALEMHGVRRRASFVRYRLQNR